MPFRFCPQCGTKLQPEFRFCPSCGEKLPCLDEPGPVKSVASLSLSPPKNTAVRSAAKTSCSTSTSIDPTESNGKYPGNIVSGVTQCCRWVFTHVNLLLLQTIRLFSHLQLRSVLHWERLVGRSSVKIPLHLRTPPLILSETTSLVMKVLVF